jgi:hypothetical protein
MHIECCCPRWTSSKSRPGFVLLNRGGLRRGGDLRYGERGPRPGREFSREHIPSKGRLGRGGVMVTLREASGETWLMILHLRGTCFDDGLWVKHALGVYSRYP